MNQVVHFMPRPNPTQLTVVYDDIALFCDEAVKKLLPVADKYTRLRLRTLHSTVSFIAAGPAAQTGRTYDFMIPFGKEIVSHSDALLNVMQIHFQGGDIAKLAQDVFSQAPKNTPGAPAMSLGEKRAVLHAFGGGRLAALLK